MIKQILNNQKDLKYHYYEKLDKLRETFDFQNQTHSFEQTQKYAKLLKQKIQQHFLLQEKLRNQINSNVDKLILENMLVKDILIRMCEKIINGAKEKDLNIFMFFDDFEEIFRAYLTKEKGLFLQNLQQATNENEKNKIKKILS